MSSDVAGGVPFVMARAALQEQLDLTPLGVPVAPEHRLDPLRATSEPAFDLVEQLDALRYGPLGGASPRWVMYDCVALPGVITGLLDVAAGRAPALRSIVLAAPMLDEGGWLLRGLAARDGAPPDALGAALGMALALLRARRVTATAPWGSAALDALARFGPLEVRAAWLPSQDHAATCVARFDVGGGLPAPAPGAAEALDTGDAGALRRLQAQIEAGARVYVLGPAAEAAPALGGGQRVPIAVGAAPGGRAS